MLSHLLELCLASLNGSLIFVNICLVAMILYDPRMPPFFGYLIPPAYFSLPVRILVCTDEIIAASYLCHGLNTAAAFILPYIVYAPYILGKELRVGRQRKHYIAIDLIRKPANIRIEFRCFQFVHTNIFCFLGFVFMLLNAGCMIGVIYNIFVFFRYRSKLSPLTTVPLVMGVLITMALWCGVLEMGRMFHVRCNKVFGSWKKFDWGSKRENGIMKRFRLSCRPILIAHGKTFVVRPLSVMIFYRGVIRGTMRVLLSTKH